MALLADALVQADRRPHVQVGRRAVAQGGAHGEAVHGLADVLGVVDGQGVGEVVAASEEQEVTHLGVRESSARRGPVGHAGEVVPQVGAAEVDRQVVGQRRLQARAEVVLRLTGLGLGALSVLDAAADVVADAVRAAHGAQVVALLVGRLENAVLHEVRVPARVGPCRGAVTQRLGTRELHIRDELGHGGVPTLLDTRGEARLARAAAPREDLDHAGRGVRAVQRAGGATLGHLDALDVGDGQVGQRGGLLTAERAAGAPGVVHAHTVDVDDRRLVGDGAGGPTEAHEAGRAGRSRDGVDLGTRDPTLEKLGHVRGRGCLDVVGTHHGDLRRQAAALGGPSRTGHHQLFHLEGGSAEAEVDGSGLPGRYGHRSLLGRVPDEDHAYRLLPGGNVEEQEAALLVREPTQLCPLNGDLRGRKRPTRVGVNHLTLDRARLRGSQRRREQERQERQRPIKDRAYLGH